MELFEVNQESQNTAFCHECGRYLQPGTEKTAFMESGEPIICCPECKAILYRDRIEEAKTRLQSRE